MMFSDSAGHFVVFFPCVGGVGGVGGAGVPKSLVQRELRRELVALAVVVRALPVGALPNMRKVGAVFSFFTFSTATRSTVSTK
jgi:hypothetical protein